MQPSPPITTRAVVEAILADRQQRAKLFAYAGSRFGIGPGDAEDLLQETALELLRQRNNVRKPEAFVFTVFRARCARFIGGQLAKRRVFLPPGPTEASAPISVHLLDRQLAFRQALASISSSCRRLLCAYYMEGLSLYETAQRLSLSRKSVPKTLSRCLKKLRESLA